MKYQSVVCDIDGTLLPQDHGIVLNEETANALLALAAGGVTIVLASARAFAGILPIAKQIHMEQYGGYIISENGAAVYDGKTLELIAAHSMAESDVLELWAQCREYKVDFAFSQRACMVASHYSKGFALDHHNCDIDYVITNHPQAYMKEPIMKCSVSACKNKISAVYPLLKEYVSTRYPYAVYHSTDHIIDILCDDCGKEAALKELERLSLLHLSSTAAIGDSYSDINMIKACGLGATLENGKAECKQSADMIVESCYENGCITFFQHVMKENDMIK